ncbi:MAG: alcohol dehydrogenase, partial [Halieaceae bacterium]
VIADPGLQPAAIALDSNLLQGMPRGITAATGMDALTHGIEAYISRWDRGNTQQMSGDAVKLIYEHLQSACDNGANLAARDALAIAAYYAGIAINQVNVGNVHAIAHQLGAKYGVPHGVANSLVLPHVLQLSRPSADQLLAQLARNCKMGKPDDSDAELASEFIQGIVRLRANIGMPDVAVDLRVADFPELIQRAVEEGDAYPSPVFFTETEVESVLRSLLPSSEQ